MQIKMDSSDAYDAYDIKEDSKGGVEDEYIIEDNEGEDFLIIKKK